MPYLLSGSGIFLVNNITVVKIDETNHHHIILIKYTISK